MAPLRTRVTVFAAAVGLYLSGVSAAILASVPIALTVSFGLVAASSWAFGFWAGASASALRLLVTFVLYHSGTIVAEVPTVLLLVPPAITDTIVVVAIGALRRAEFRRAVTEVELRKKNAELEAALAEVKELRGILPICAWCKSVCDVTGMWNRLEAYLSRHSHVTLTHGICPTCVARLERQVEDLSRTG